MIHNHHMMKMRKSLPQHNRIFEMKFEANIDMGCLDCEPIPLFSGKSFKTSSRDYCSRDQMPTQT